MNWPRLALRLLGRRLPRTTGTLEVEGLDGPLWIGRDRFGVPHIRAGSERDGWFGLGFCQGQDRAFQLETRARLVRGTLAALLGRDALSLDRLARRIDFAGIGTRGLAVMPTEDRLGFEAFAAGVRSGMGPGGGARSHEFVLLRTEPSDFGPADAIGFLSVLSFTLASNWDVELARLRMLALDGAEAVEALHPAYPANHPVSDRPGEQAVEIIDALASDLASVGGLSGAGSNNWAVAGARTESGRPIVANDPHLAPLLPAHWYLAHVETPYWSLAGGTIPGTPAFGFGHNGFGAWGISAGLIDNTDLFVEEIGPDGASVRRDDGFVPCLTRSETIEVRRGAPVTIEVLETDRGPVVGPAFEGPFGALSMAATWLEPGDVGVLLRVGRFRTFEELREGFREWSSVPLNLVWGDAKGSIGFQLIGAAPVRGAGGGTLPTTAADPGTAWSPDRVPYDDMPFSVDPERGFVAAANNLPTTDIYLGSDFLDGYRAERISELLSGRGDWTTAAMLEMQMDQTSIPWREMRGGVLAVASEAGDLEVAVNVLRDWNGDMVATEPGAAVFATFSAALARMIAVAKAPRSYRLALGEGFTPLVPFSGLLVRRTSHLVRLLDERPDGWFPAGWDEVIRDALREAQHTLRTAAGDDPRQWAWGTVRRLTLVHPLGLRRPLDRVWNIGPIPTGGDANTINPAPVDPTDPLGSPSFAIASGRMVVELGDWDHARFCLAGGQSGNPFSPHYADQVEMWSSGDAMTLAWSQPEVDRVVHRIVELTPT